MPMHVIDEKAVLPETGQHGNTVPVRVLSDDGTTARVQIEGCGIHLRQGAVHTVASTAVRRSR
ncbi:hypothetical protein [Streptomyces coelicoflavus]|uniref:hypothetical protein n=1 Tax=Streptomyces coelicoflavus TaxID=285562 RepID=UPI00131F2A73|nr:hypothetical protein [Streptomyces coelicoflavus]